MFARQIRGGAGKKGDNDPSIQQWRLPQGVTKRVFLGTKVFAEANCEPNELQLEGRIYWKLGGAGACASS